MSGTAGLATFALLALVLANAWRTSRSTLTSLAQGKIATGPWKTIGLELGGVVVLAFVANASDGAAKVILVLAVGLWLLFAINVWGRAPATSTKGAAA
jgi:hypothetical protein